ncbi:hypothetical protein HDU93_000009 [Gonapodya sp. JEL0774]|nr:hypothetical protein HDU93_000009 [Gonapodya sp. JEL0774]
MPPRGRKPNHGRRRNAASKGRPWTEVNGGESASHDANGDNGSQKDTSPHESITVSGSESGIECSSTIPSSYRSHQSGLEHSEDRPEHIPSKVQLDQNFDSYHRDRIVDEEETDESAVGGDAFAEPPVSSLREESMNSPHLISNGPRGFMDEDDNRIDEDENLTDDDVPPAGDGSQGLSPVIRDTVGFFVHQAESPRTGNHLLPSTTTDGHPVAPAFTNRPTDPAMAILGRILAQTSRKRNLPKSPDATSSSITFGRWDVRRHSRGLERLLSNGGNDDISLSKSDLTSTEDRLDIEGVDNGETIPVSDKTKMVVSTSSGSPNTSSLQPALDPTLSPCRGESPANQELFAPNNSQDGLRSFNSLSTAESDGDQHSSAPSLISSPLWSHRSIAPTAGPALPHRPADLITYLLTCSTGDLQVVLKTCGPAIFYHPPIPSDPLDRASPQTMPWTALLVLAAGGRAVHAARFARRPDVNTMVAAALANPRVCADAAARAGVSAVLASWARKMEKDTRRQVARWKRDAERSRDEAKRARGEKAKVLEDREKMGEVWKHVEEGIAALKDTQVNIQREVEARMSARERDAQIHLQETQTKLRDAVTRIEDVMGEGARRVIELERLLEEARDDKARLQMEVETARADSIQANSKVAAAIVKTELLRQDLMDARAEAGRARKAGEQDAKEVKLKMENLLKLGDAQISMLRKQRDAEMESAGAEVKKLEQLIKEMTVESECAKRKLEEKVNEVIAGKKEQDLLRGDLAKMEEDRDRWAEQAQTVWSRCARWENIAADLWKSRTTFEDKSIQTHITAGESVNSQHALWSSSSTLDLDGTSCMLSQLEEASETLQRLFEVSECDRELVDEPTGNRYGPKNAGQVDPEDDYAIRSGLPRSASQRNRSAEFVPEGSKQMYDEEAADYCLLDEIPEPRLEQRKNEKNTCTTRYTLALLEQQLTDATSRSQETMNKAHVIRDFLDTLIRQLTIATERAALLDVELACSNARESNLIATMKTFDNNSNQVDGSSLPHCHNPLDSQLREVSKSIERLNSSESHIEELRGTRARDNIAKLVDRNTEQGGEGSGEDQVCPSSATSDTDSHNLFPEVQNGIRKVGTLFTFGMSAKTLVQELAHSCYPTLERVDSPKDDSLVLCSREPEDFSPSMDPSDMLGVDSKERFLCWDPPNGAGYCALGVCNFACDDGFSYNGTACVRGLYYSSTITSDLVTKIGSPAATATLSVGVGLEFNSPTGAANNNTQDTSWSNSFPVAAVSGGLAGAVVILCGTLLCVWSIRRRKGKVKTPELALLPIAVIDADPRKSEIDSNDRHSLVDLSALEDADAEGIAGEDSKSEST